MNIGRFARRNAVGLVLLGSFSGCSGLVIYPVYQHAALSVQRQKCQSNLKEILRACRQYQDDYDGRYPPLSDGGARGWSLILRERVPSLNFSCRAGYKSSFSPSSDYFFNAQLATRTESSVRDPLYTVAFGDGPDNGPSNSHYWELPNYTESESSPIQRHNINGSYVFADGHVRIIPPSDFQEWMDTIPQNQQVHPKFSPDESAFRTKRGPTRITR